MFFMGTFLTLSILRLYGIGRGLTGAALGGYAGGKAGAAPMGTAKYSEQFTGR
jgi:hypothetical protein